MGRFSGTRFNQRIAVTSLATAMLGFSACTFPSPPQASPKRGSGNTRNVAQSAALSFSGSLATPNICATILQERLSQEDGGLIEVANNVTTPYTTSNEIESLRGSATVRFASTNRFANYRYDCAVALRTGVVTQFNYQRVDSSEPSRLPDAGTDRMDSSEPSRSLNGSSADRCVRNLRQQVAQETGGWAEVTANTGMPSFVSNAEERVQGRATLRLENVDSLVDYRYECTINIRTGNVTQLTYRRITLEAGDRPKIPIQDAYNRGYRRGQYDALNTQTYDPSPGGEDADIRNAPDLANAYSRGYVAGYQAAIDAANPPPIDPPWSGPPVLGGW